MSDSRGRNELKAWLWVLACAAMIIATIPFARGLQKFVYATAGRELFTYASLICIALGSAWGIYYIAPRKQIRGLARYFWLALCAGSYAYLAISLRRFPEESLHLIEYGLLSLLLFRALRYRIGDSTIYLTAAFSVLIFGVVDELVQWVMPGRSWDYRDIGTNTLGGFLSLLCLSLGIKPEGVSGPVKRRSVHILTAVMTAALLITGLCLLNTPQAVRQYTSYIPALSWLRHEEPMTVFDASGALSGIAAALAAIWALAWIWTRRLDD